ncbi:MAG: hypothetical protein AB7I41_11895 [Candidatus Sericytochromatia bacterium]
MKNLRKHTQASNPQLKALHTQLQAPVAGWADLSQSEQTELCLHYLALPLLQKEGALSPAVRQVLAPSAADLAPQVSQLYSEMPSQFATVHDLLDKTTALFLISEQD